MIDSISSYISSVCGLCKNKKFPGTIASFVALVFSLLLYYFLNESAYIAIFILILLVGSAAVWKVQNKEGKLDHQWIGIDEVLGMLVANLFLFEVNLSFKETLAFAFISFLVFRLIDITKFIPPIKTINKKEVQNAYTVIFDDILAGFYTYFIMLVVLGVYNLHFLYASFLILLPAMIANATPTLLKMERFNMPVDEKIFGKNKTWRGFIGAVITGTFFFFLLVKFGLINFPGDFRIITLAGFLFGFGAIGGDLLESFFKRKMGLIPGESLTPWDQIDYVLGAIVLTFFIFQYSMSQIIFLVILGGTISAVTHRLGYILKINTSKQ